jgi:hypothetical protein
MVAFESSGSEVPRPCLLCLPCLPEGRHRGEAWGEGEIPLMESKSRVDYPLVEAGVARY